MELFKKTRGNLTFSTCLDMIEVITPAQTIMKNKKYRTKVRARADHKN